MIEKDTFEQWKSSEATKEVFQVLMEFRRQMMELWAEGKYDPQQNLEATAKCQLYKDFVELDYETIQELYGVNK